MMVKENEFLDRLKKMLNTSEEINLDTDLLDIQEWDSLSMMNFIVMCEEEFGVSVERHIVAESVVVEDLFDAVNK